MRCNEWHHRKEDVGTQHHAHIRLLWEIVKKKNKSLCTSTVFTYTVPIFIPEWYSQQHNLPIESIHLTCVVNFVWFWIDLALFPTDIVRVSSAYLVFWFPPVLVSHVPCVCQSAPSSLCVLSGCASFFRQLLSFSVRLVIVFAVYGC